MKKIFLLTVVLMLLIAPVVFAEGEAPVSKLKSVLKITLDGKGELEGSEGGYTATADVDTGFSVASEFTNSMNPNLDAGVGISVQLPRSVSGSDISWHFIPVYGLVRAYPSPEELPVYLTGQVGWNYFNGDGVGADYSGGLYYGTGIGYMSKQFLIELLYSKNNGQVEAYGSQGDVEYTKVGLSIGIVF